MRGLRLQRMLEQAGWPGELRAQPGRIMNKRPPCGSDGPDYATEWRAGIEIGAGEESSELCLVVTYSDGKSFSRQARQRNERCPAALNNGGEPC